MGHVASTQILGGGSFHLAPAMWSIGAMVSKVHGIWKLYIKGTTYLNPDNFFGLSAGLMYESLIGDRTLLKLPTVPFFIMAKFLDLFEQEDAWENSFRLWKEALYGAQPIHADYTQAISRYKISWIRYQCQQLIGRIQRIAARTFQFAWDSVQLILRIMDIVEFITLDPAKLNALLTVSVRESGLNIPRCLNTLVQNKSVFLKRLEQKEAGIEQALQLLEAKTTHAADILEKVKALLDKCEHGLVLYEKASTAVGSALKELGKKCLYDWSPEPLRQMLRERGVAPISDHEDRFQKVLSANLAKPARPLLSYAKRKTIKTPSLPKGDSSSSSDSSVWQAWSGKHNTFSPSAEQIRSAYPKLLKI